VTHIIPKVECDPEKGMTQTLTPDALSGIRGAEFMRPWPHQLAEEGFAPAAGVVHELEEAQVQSLLQNSSGSYLASKYSGLLGVRDTIC
jgi:hypothetical protein